MAEVDKENVKYDHLGHPYAFNEKKPEATKKLTCLSGPYAVAQLPRPPC